ncbi:hypothetical protein VEE48_30020 [Escherichia coli]|nr:hypothetical protein VEE48_30020 [Escherichia coli]
MKNTELEQLINEKLNSAAISDYAPNGLQVEGKETVQKIVTGVTASQALLDEAVRLGRGCGHCASWLLLERRVSGHSRNEA